MKCPTPRPRSPGFSRPCTSIGQLKAQGYPVRDDDMARLSPFVRKHVGVHGTCSFALPGLEPSAIRELRDPDDGDDDGD